METGVSPLLSRINKFWVAGILAFVIVVWLLKGIMFPFVLALIIAYCLDPLCDKLETRGLSRSLAVGLVTLIFILVGFFLVLLIMGPLVTQVVSLIQASPRIFSALNEWFLTFIDKISLYLPEASFFQSDKKLAMDREEVHDLIKPLLGEKTIDLLSNQIAGSAGSLFSLVISLFKNIWSGSLLLINTLSLIIVTPFVAFYLLKDWDKMMVGIDALLPRSHQEDVRQLARSIDETLAGFLRGQSAVVIILTVYYCVALRLVNLDFWLLVGFVSGSLTFIPFVGAFIGFVLSVSLALYQFDSLYPVLVTLSIFFLGQFVEGNILTPKLVGGRVGLSPVWIMFALLAGGSLFGFVGILIAVPVAAIAGVVVRFAVEKYRRSLFYEDRRVYESGRVYEDGRATGRAGLMDRKKQDEKSEVIDT